MDKRTLLFVLALAVTFFGVNTYFNYHSDKRNAEAIKQQEMQKSRKESEVKADVAKRTLNPSVLQTAPLWKDDQRNERVAYGVWSGQAWIALNLQEGPGTLYADTKNGLEKVQRCTPFDSQGQLVLYSTQCPATINTNPLPVNGQYDLQLVWFSQQSQKPQISLALWQGGQLNILGAIPPKQALVLQASSNEIGYSVLGLYVTSSKTLMALKDIPGLSSSVVVDQPTAAATIATGEVVSLEQFYVLENETMQLVFSTKGGALAEINLPFPSTANPKSVVLPIEFDFTMQKQHPYNDLFPAQDAFFAGEKTTRAPQLGGYYPLIRRTVVLNHEKETLTPPARFYALNVVSDFPEVADLIYRVKEFDSNHIVFEALQSHRRITKTFTISTQPDAPPYCFDMAIQVEGDNRGLWLTSGVPEVELMSGSSTPILKYRITKSGKPDVSKIDLPKEKETLSMSSVHPDWVVNSNGYLGLIMDPLTEPASGFKVQYVPGKTVPTRLIDIDQQYSRYKASSYPGYNLLLPLPATLGTKNYRIFAGPFEDDILKAIDSRFKDPATGYNPDYLACQTFFGWFSFISEPFAKFLYFLMSFFYSVTHSWAFSIILLTVALRVMLFPLNSWSMKSMKRMQQLTPEVTAIQARWKKEPKRAQVEVMNLYRTKKINPLTGCFPLLIQMPFLIGMFDLLKSTFELRGAPFIPGWIDNLTAPDILFRWNYPLPFFGTQFHLLPFLLGAVMFFQQRMSTATPKDKSLMTDQQRQQQFMGNIMVVVFTVMFYNFPSGLNIYWLSSMLLGMLQQWWTNRSIKKSNNSNTIEIKKV